MEPCAAHGGEHPDHGGDDTALLDKADLLVEDRRWIAVETDYEPPMHLQAGLLDVLYRGQQVAVPVLYLAALAVALLVRSLDADKDLFEPRPDHQLHETAVVGQIDGCLGVKVKWATSFLHPIDHGREDLPFQLPPVADKVVVDEKYGPAPSTGIEAL